MAKRVQDPKEIFPEIIDDYKAVFGDDLLENMRITAWVNDADGDATVVESPWLHAIPMDEHVGARNFTPNSSVTLVVFDTDGVSPLIDPQTVSTEPNGHAEIPLWGLVDLDPGQFIEVSDDSTGYSKRMEVKYVTLDRVDTVADFAEGVAPADAAMILHLMDNGMNYGFDLTADGSGHWEFDFTQPGVALDLSESAWVEIWVVEPDGDATSDDLPVFQAKPADEGAGGGRQFHRSGTLPVNGPQKRVQKILLNRKIVEPAQVVLQGFQFFNQPLHLVVRV